jgi:hypothetical protein
MINILDNKECGSIPGSWVKLKKFGEGKGEGYEFSFLMGLIW